MENEEFDFGDEIVARYDVSDPSNPRLISSRPGGKKPRSRNAQKQADLRARRAEDGLNQTQVFVPPEQKQALKTCVEHLCNGGDPIAGLAAAQADLAAAQAEITRKGEELSAAQAEITRMGEELSSVQARLARIPSWIRRIFR